MNCEPFRNQIGAWLDGEITPPGQANALESHLTACVECRAYTDDLREVNASLRGLAAGHRQQAEAIADRVVAKLAVPSTHSTAAGRAPRSWIVPLAALLGAAAGFLLAWMIFVPADRPRTDVAHAPPMPDPGPAPSVGAEREQESAATLVNVIGDVKVTPLADSPLKQMPALALFACPSDSVVETGADSQCELVTRTGCVVRLDRGTKLVVRSPHEVEIYEGQLYCAAPDGMELNVIAAEGSPQKAGASPGKSPQLSPWETSLQCRSNASCWTVSGPQGIKVTSASGEVDLRTALSNTTLKSGESCEIVSGAIQPVSANGDPLLSTRWINPLLIQKGPDNVELRQRVDAMLAQIGQTKLSSLYESEIRSLGEYGVLPLIRFLESPLSEQNSAQRRSAARIVSDLAPTWAIGDLVKLLEHTDGEVRGRAAAALHRLTGEALGRTQDDWQTAPDAGAVDRWRNWWKTNRARYPSLEEIQKRGSQDAVYKL